MSGFLDFGWYDKGGVLSPGLTEVRNNSGEPIPVATAEQVKRGLDYIRERYHRDEEEDAD